MTRYGQRTWLLEGLCTTRKVIIAPPPEGTGTGVRYRPGQRSCLDLVPRAAKPDAPSRPALGVGRPAIEPPADHFRWCRHQRPGRRFADCRRVAGTDAR